MKPKGKSDRLADQARIHAEEIRSLTLAGAAYRKAAQTALDLLEARSRNEWTPADDKRLAEIRELLKP